MALKFTFSKERNANLPTVRIKKIVLENFKSIEHGEITLNCGRAFIPCGSESDILGLYGQNGSGKTSVIEALAITKYLMSGSEIPWPYADCIAVTKAAASISVSFDLQYPCGVIREATYSFELSRGDYSEEEKRAKSKEITDIVSVLDIPENIKRVIVQNEKIELAWESSKKRQTIIDTNCDNMPFIPDTKRKELLGTNKELLIEQRLLKKKNQQNSCSYIFDVSTINIFSKNSNQSIYSQVITELCYYANRFLIVIDNPGNNLINSSTYFLPIFTRDDTYVIDERHTETYSVNTFELYSKEINKISSVLNALIPNLTIELKETARTILPNGDPGIQAIPVAHRSDIEVPLYGESDGVRKIISMLSMIIETYNQKSTTLAIDEFDSGVFEYLLGEILEIIEDSGKGQLIFTSHNLRPLEVIDKKFIYFTTTNPKNRYIRLKNIATTNNLRDTYFREIVMCEQDETIYNGTKRYKIVAALKNAAYADGRS